jgi:hypothetical protein
MSVFNLLNDASLSGTWKVLFAEGDFSASPQPDEIFYDFGEIGEVTLEQDITTRQRYRFECGKKVKDEEIVQEEELGFGGKLMNFPRETLRILYRATDGDNYGQTALSAVEVDAFEFGTTPAVVGRFYQITNSGKNVFSVTNLTLTEGANTLVNGTDYVLEKATGLVRFLTAQSADVTVTATADAFDVAPLKLHGDAIKEGKVRFLFFPAKSTVGTACDAEIIINAEAQVLFDESLTIGADSDAEPNVKFEVTKDPEVFDLRQIS